MQAQQALLKNIANTEIEKVIKVLKLLFLPFPQSNTCFFAVKDGVQVHQYKSNQCNDRSQQHPLWPFQNLPQTQLRQQCQQPQYTQVYAAKHNKPGAYIPVHKPFGQRDHLFLQ